MSGLVNFQFDWPWVFVVLPFPLFVRMLPPLVRNEASLKVPFFSLLDQITSGSLISEKIQWHPLLVGGMIWVLLVFSAARPQWVGDPVEIPLSGRNVMLAVDLSGSMKERDLKLKNQLVSRLDVVKAVLKNFIKKREGDRLGLILFGDQAYLQTPLTFDHRTLTHMLLEAELGLAGEMTAIGDSIGLAVKILHELNDEEKVLILLTDGRNTAGSIAPRRAAELAKEAGLKIHVIGVGAEEKWVKSLIGKRMVNPSAELDERMLSDLSSITGGSYFRARSTSELEKIYSLIDELEPIEKDKQLLRPLTALFIWPLLVSIFIGLFWCIWQILHSKEFKEFITRSNHA